LQEVVLKSLNVITPIDHTAGHRGAFSCIVAILKEAETGVVKEAYSIGNAKYAFLPMGGVGGHRNEGYYFRTVFAMGVGTFGEPVLDGW
jgi:hypothetical protein